MFDLSLTDMPADTDCTIKSLVEPMYPDLGITCVAWWNRFLQIPCVWDRLGKSHLANAKTRFGTRKSAKLLAVFFLVI